MEKYVIQSKDTETLMAMSYDPRTKILWVGSHKDKLGHLSRLVRKHMGFTRKQTVKQGIRQICKYRYYLIVESDDEFRVKMEKARKHVNFLPIQKGIAKYA